MDQDTYNLFRIHLVLKDNNRFIIIKICPTPFGGRKHIFIARHARTTQI